MRPAGDAAFVQIVDEAFADAARRSGPWLACKPGCNQCCTGVFSISPLDTARLREGARQLELQHPATAARLRLRVQASTERLRPGFPGDPSTGLLGDTDTDREAFEGYGDDEVCPVLDPETGLCELYEYRPLTCRTFGPPVRLEEGFGVCELCFVDAPAETVAACALELPPTEAETQLTVQTGSTGETIVAFALQQTVSA